MKIHHHHPVISFVLGQGCVATSPPCGETESVVFRLVVAVDGWQSEPVV
jgi:hypothetical protein